MPHIVFIWDDWNESHATRHGVDRAEIEFVIRSAKAPFPKNAGDGKRVVQAQARTGWWVQVVFVEQNADEVDPMAVSLEDLMSDDVSFIYPIHARPLTDAERHVLTRK